MAGLLPDRNIFSHTVILSYCHTVTRQTHTYKTSLLHCPGGFLVAEGLEEDQEHDDEECSEEAVVHDVEERDLD